MRGTVWGDYIKMGGRELHWRGHPLKSVVEGKDLRAVTLGSGLQGALTEVLN